MITADVKLIYENEGSKDYVGAGVCPFCNAKVELFLGDVVFQTNNCIHYFNIKRINDDLHFEFRKD